MLDKTDRRILHALQLDSSISNHELANSIGLSPSPCLRRVKHLEKEGFIKEYVARLDPQRLELDVMVLIHVGLENHTPSTLNKFEKIVSSLQEVMECLLITGQSYDYQLKVIVQDLEAYQNFLLNKITQIDGVTSVHSSFILRKVVNHQRLPIEKI